MTKQTKIDIHNRKRNLELLLGRIESNKDILPVNRQALLAFSFWFGSRFLGSEYFYYAWVRIA